MSGEYVMSPIIKGFLSVIVFVLLMWFGWSKYSDFLSQGQAPPMGTVILNKMDEKGVPDVNFIDLAGETHRLSDYKGKIIILNFWASWCDPCVAEFPSLLNLIKKYNEDLVLIALSADTNEKDLNGFLKAFEAKAPNLVVSWDKDKSLAETFGTKVLPESYIIGPNRELIRKIAGVDDWYTPEAIAYFKELIDTVIKGEKVEVEP